MRYLTGILLSLIILVFFIALVYFYSESVTSNKFYTPVPDKVFNSQRISQNDFWYPSNKKIFSKVKKPQINAVSAITYDLTIDTVLYEKNISQKHPMASLTKIMTAIVALENFTPSDVLTVDAKSASVGESSMGLTKGEKLSVEELLYGLFLNSANDSAETLATSTKYGRDNFIYQMNKKAENLGLSNTRFSNPSGLEGDGLQYSTAVDLLVMAKYAIENPHILKIASTYYKFIPYTYTHKAFELYNETNLLTSYPGVKGLKTGYTLEAGLCLVTYLEYKNHRIIGVLLNSPSRREEMIELLDYSLKSLGIKPPSRG